MRLYLNALGTVNALGRGKDEILPNLLAGNKSGIRMLPDVLASGEPIPFGAVSAELDAVPECFRSIESRNLALALTALNEIKDEVEHAIKAYGPTRVAVVAASSTAGAEEGEKALKAYQTDGSFPKGYRFERQEMGTVGLSIADYFGLGAPAITLSTACSSSAKAFASAARLIRANIVDAVIVGGVDSYCRMTLNGFDALSALSHTACLPFSKNRDGTVLGEGAAFFLMTKEPGPIFLAGVGQTSDAHNMTAPHPEGAGAHGAMKAALSEAQIQAQDVDYVNMHGTGTRLNDAAEAKAVERIFGADVPCSSTKALTGHTLGAAGAIEAALCWLLVSDLNRDHVLPAHIWDGCADLDMPPIGLLQSEGKFKSAGPLWCMSNSYAFGGSNASVIIGRVD
ncbi:MAG: beta-ketoacyl-ACP synthase [Sphingomonadales bacterium]|jgi:3-oxoacyl-[acyl-carrier-protein] synthase-1